jgi:hypothetical protein
MYRLAIFASHPIQYQTPLFKKMAEDGRVEPTVYFAGRGASEEAYDAEFGRTIKWDIPLLDGYPHVFLSGNMHLPRILASRKEKFDAVLVFGWNSFDIFLIYLASLFSGTPVFLRSESPLNQELLKRGFRQSIKRFLLRLFFKGIAAFLYIGEENRRFYERLGVPRRKLFFAPYAVDNERLAEEAEKLKPARDAIRKELGIAAGTSVILSSENSFRKRIPWIFSRHMRRCGGMTPRFFSSAKELCARRWRSSPGITA